MDVYDEDEESPEMKSGLSAIFTKMIHHKSGETRHPRPLKKVHSMTLHKHMESFSEEENRAAFLEELDSLGLQPLFKSIGRSSMSLAHSPTPLTTMKWKKLFGKRGCSRRKQLEFIKKRFLFSSTFCFLVYIGFGIVKAIQVASSAGEEEALFYIGYLIVRLGTVLLCSIPLAPCLRCKICLTLETAVSIFICVVVCAIMVSSNMKVDIEYGRLGTSLTSLWKLVDAAAQNATVAISSRSVRDATNAVTGSDNIF